MEQFVRILTAIFSVAASLFVASLLVAFPAITPDKATLWVQKRTTTFAFWLLAVLVANSVGVLLAANPAHAATFTVNRTADTPDANLSNAACDVSTSALGRQCTLRAAIQEANDTSGKDIILFNIPDRPNIPGLEVKTISPNSALPTITEAVTINGYSQPGASPNTLAKGNNAVLKIQLTGTDTVRSGAHGLVIQGPNSTVRGLVINEFIERDGIHISGSSAKGNKVKGNFIGTDATGSADLGNGTGVFVFDAPSNTIGGTAVGARNVLSGNDLAGIVIYLSGAEGNKVKGNYIGTDASGTQPLGNSIGVVVSELAANNTIGGTESGAANVISSNGTAGVNIAWRTPGNSVLSNSIFSNGSEGGLGIDLGAFPPDGVTANDEDDPDTGANNLQNFPVISSAIRNRTTGTTTITATLNSNPNQTYTIQCFLTEAGGDPSGHGEGQRLLDTTTTSTGANGDSVPFSCTSHVPAVGDRVTMTATNTSGTAANTSIGDTSEFAQNVVVTRGS